ncbi:Vacuolar protein sorting-associated protein 13A (Fragment) [Geodia barretti]|uniref:Vacuolar protein sorting-associated protein 13A n=1 Tax=Geodia barretti TaxID=519541 RepID=A0AA35TRC9_GEOBA
MVCVQVLNVLTDDLGYHKVSIFSPYWMTNKTGRDIEYLVDGKAIKHPSSKSLILLSTSNPKNNIQIRTRTNAGKLTDWTLKFSLNAVGTSGNFPARYGQELYIFGVEAHLSQFTLTKIVNISPYYMLVNETETDLYVAETADPHNIILLPPGELVPFWPVTDGSKLRLTPGLGKEAVVFNYKRPDTVCLKLNDEIQVVCVDIQESESAIITSFTPYYPGCVPVQIINHFPDVTIQFMQDAKQSKGTIYTLEPGETVFYTWDHPNDRRALRWGLLSLRVKDPKHIFVDKNDQQMFRIRSGDSSSAAGSSTFWMDDNWVDVDENFSERLVSPDDSNSDTSSISSASTSRGDGVVGAVEGRSASRAYWKSFISGIQRVVLFTPFLETVDRIKVVGSYSRPQVEVLLGLSAVGLSLVDNSKKRELAYIAITQSGVIWQVEKVNAEEVEVLSRQNAQYIVQNIKTYRLEEPTGKISKLDVKYKNVSGEQQLRFLGHNPQVLYPLPPPPTVASETVLHSWFHAATGMFMCWCRRWQSMLIWDCRAWRVVAFSQGRERANIHTEICPKDLDASKSFFDVLHIAPIKMVVSFNVRSVGKNKDSNTVGDRVLELFLHSLGAILTSVQDTEMKFSLFHMEYQMKTGRALTRKLIKHYRTQALVELYTLVLGLDVLGNPVNVVRGVVGGTIDLFYEPIKGSVLGPEEFLEGLGIGLRSFVGGTVGGITGAGAKITGAVGDVFAKLTFDEQFQDKRQQRKTKPPRLGSKFGGFAKNVFEGVTGVVAQPVKGAQKEGAVGLFKGVGKGLVGLVVRPTGGLIDLTSGTLDFVTRKTQVGNFEIKDIRPPRFIGRDGVVRPFSPGKALGTALLRAVDEGKVCESVLPRPRQNIKEGNHPSA